MQVSGAPDVTDFLLSSSIPVFCVIKNKVQPWHATAPILPLTKMSVISVYLRSVKLLPHNHPETLFY